MLFMTSLARSQTVEVIPNKDIFCFSRREAEKIYSCLSIRKQVTLDIANKEQPIIAPQQDFLSTDYGRVLIFLLGGALGYSIHK